MGTSWYCFFFFEGTDSSGTSLANPTCGGTYTYSLPVGKGTSFFCHPSLKGTYVIITILRPITPLTLCEVEVYSERRGNQYIKNQHIQPLYHCNSSHRQCDRFFSLSLA